METAALLAVAFGLGAGICWGIGDFWGAKVSKRIGGQAAAFMFTVVSTLLFTAVYLVFFRDQTMWDLHSFLYASIAGVAFTLGNLAFYKGLEVGPVSIVSPLGSLYPLVTTLLLVISFGATIAFRQTVGVCIVVTGVMAASGLFEKVRSGKQMGRGPTLGLIAACAWGIGWGLVAQAVGGIGWQLTSLLELWASSIAFLPLLPMLKRAQPDFFKQLLPALKSRLLLAVCLVTEGGFLIVSMGVEHVSSMVTTVVVVSSCYPALTVFLALRHLKEEFQPIPVVGGLMAVAGIVVLSLG